MCLKSDIINGIELNETITMGVVHATVAHLKMYLPVIEVLFVEKSSKSFKKKPVVGN